MRFLWRRTRAQPSIVPEALRAVESRIARACERAGRPRGEVTLVVVTKDVDASRAREAVAAGATDLGENRAQEFLQKAAELSGLEPAPRWHFIGSLQRNKVRSIVGRVALVHSVDSIPLGLDIGKRAADADLVQDVLLEVNVGGEPSKHGFAPAYAAEALDALAAEPGLAVRGLMTVAPAGSKALAREAFRSLRELRDELRTTLSGAGGLADLSMGMTSDFEEAVEEGATIVRIGTAIFGERAR
jgi:hypothetical protein